MVLAMLRCSVVGKWTGGAVGAETGKLIGDFKVLGEPLRSFPIMSITYYISAAWLGLGVVSILWG